MWLLKMVARYRPGSFGWMQMHRQHGSNKPKYNPQTSGSQELEIGSFVNVSASQKVHLHVS